MVGERKHGSLKSLKPNGNMFSAFLRQITAALFDEVYSRSQHIIETGSLLAVRGRLRKRKGELQLMASRVMPLPEVSSLLKNATVLLSPAASGDEVCLGFEKVFSSFPGEASVEVAVDTQSGDTVVVLLRNTGIEPCKAFVDALTELPYVAGVELGLGDEE